MCVTENNNVKGAVFVITHEILVLTATNMLPADEKSPGETVPFKYLCLITLRMSKALKIGLPPISAKNDNQDSTASQSVIDVTSIF